jgi:hypothetical protein
VNQSYSAKIFLRNSRSLWMMIFFLLVGCHLNALAEQNTIFDPRLINI